MADLIMVVGGSRSGKSATAEKLAKEFEQELGINEKKALMFAGVHP